MDHCRGDTLRDRDLFRLQVKSGRFYSVVKSVTASSWACRLFRRAYPDPLGGGSACVIGHCMDVLRNHRYPRAPGEYPPCSPTGMRIRQQQSESVHLLFRLAKASHIARGTVAL